MPGFGLFFGSARPFGRCRPQEPGGHSANPSEDRRNARNPCCCKGFWRCALVSLGRFELPAFRLGGERSIQLSYRDIYRDSGFGTINGGVRCNTPLEVRAEIQPDGI